MPPKAVATTLSTVATTLGLEDVSMLNNNLAVVIIN